ncbi:MAG: radical SAM protein [Candidatus Paceibacterota bacterium]
MKKCRHFSNLRCKYCFSQHKEQSAKTIMPDALVEKLIREYTETFDGKLLFIWFGGEPLLAGLPFFEKIVQWQRRYGEGRMISNGIQTNGTLINDEWADFFTANDFGVGVSIDGAEASHNAFRYTASGKGSHERTVSGIKCLMRHGITPGIIQVLTKNSLKNVREDFIFFTEELGLKRMGTNPYICDGINIAMEDQEITDEELTAYFKNLIDLWVEKDDPNFNVRDIENMAAGILGRSTGGCTYSGTCTAYFSVNVDGLVYPCNRLVMPENVFGDLKTQHLSEILSGEKRMSFACRATTFPEECNRCSLKQACSNGCIGQREGGYSGRFVYCESRKNLFRYLKQLMEGGDENEKENE